MKKKISFDLAVKNWLSYKKISVKPSTYYRYKYIINTYILSYFENKEIYFFADYDFNIYIDYLTKQLAPKTIADIMIVFKSILKYIKQKYQINYELDLVPIPKNKSTEINILNNREIKKLENYCIEGYNPKYIGIILALNTGMRLGELCALTWSDINLRERLISINKTVQRLYISKGKTELQINEPKTRNSIRKIPISKKLLEILKDLKKHCKISNDYFFLTSSTKCIDPRNYYSMYKSILKLCKIRDHNFHILRHTFATNCIKIGMDVKSLSEILGHSNVQMTLNRYVHSSYSIQKKFLDKL